MQAYVKLVLCLSVLVPCRAVAQALQTELPPAKDDLLAVVQAGPAKPMFLRDSLALPDSALARYTEEYGRHMARTETLRGKALATLKKADRDETGRGHRSAAGPMRTILREDGIFEHNHLMPLLTPDQRRAFHWPRVKGMHSAPR